MPNMNPVGRPPRPPGPSDNAKRVQSDGGHDGGSTSMQKRKKNPVPDSRTMLQTTLLGLTVRIWDEK